MLQRPLVLILLLQFFFTLSVSAQVTISGRVINDETGEPVANASVYINNTTIGMNSDSQGNFTLSGVKPGIYEIIVSHLSYDKLIHRVEVANQSLRISFRVVQGVKQMRNIVIMRPDLRKKWLATFKEYFLGQSQAAAKSKIKNEDDIFFEKGQSPGSMIAFSEAPLIIENRELGYRIYFELQEFFYDQTDGRTYFYGFSRYEELDEKKSSQTRWHKNRLRTYLGSTQHFYHSILSNKLEEEAYVIYLRKDADSSAYMKTQKTPTGVSIGLGNQQKLQPSKIAVAVTVSDILFSVDSLPGKKLLRWSGELVVRYKKDPYEKKYLRNKGHTSGYLQNGVQSGIVMIEPEVFLDPNGTLENPLAVQYTGFWSYERVANMLPLNYRP